MVVAASPTCFLHIPKNAESSISSALEVALPPDCWLPGSRVVVTVLPVRLFYVDDSGNETVTTFSAVSVSGAGVDGGAGFVAWLAAPPALGSRDRRAVSIARGGLAGGQRPSVG